MAKLAIAPGSVDVSLLLYIQHGTTGDGLTGLVYNAAGLVAYYARPGATPAAITLATQTVTGAHSDGGFVELDAANMPGFYRLDLPDAVAAAGVRSAGLLLKGAANMKQLPLEIDLNAQVNLAQWLGTAPLALSSQRVQALAGVITDGAIGAATFAAGAINAAALAADAGTEIANAVKAIVVETEGSYTVAQALSIILAAAAGRSSNNGLTFATPNNVETRIAATVDGSNNRTAITLTPSA